MKTELFLSISLAFTTHSVQAGSQPKPLAPLKTAAIDARQEFSKEFSSNKCYGALLGTLTAWSPEYNWQESLGRAPYKNQFNSIVEPTGSSVWVSQNQTTSEIEARKISHNSRVRVIWKLPDCVAQTSLYEPPTPNLSGFTDTELTSLLMKSEKGIIFAYSDKMHLSLEAKKIIQKLTIQMGIPVQFLLDPESQSKNGQKLNSEELVRRGMTLHYPSLLVYAHGKIQSPMLPGRKTSEQYQSFIKEYLR